VKRGEPPKPAPRKATSARKVAAPLAGKATRAAAPAAKKAAPKRAATAKKAAPKRAAAAKKTAPRVAPSEKLQPLLTELRQGDIISLGAVTMVGLGPTAATKMADEQVAADELWAVTVDSEVGWYVILSGSCDIERDVDIEPCLAISPVAVVDAARYQNLRRGSYSPREFPLPPYKLAQACEVDAGTFYPVVDARFITSLDKTALLNAEVNTLRPLTGPQQKRFGEWVANRFGRAAHPGEMEDNVLGRLGNVVKRLSRDFDRKEPKDRTPEAKLVGASTHWFLTPGDRTADVHIVVSEASCKAAGLFNTAAGEIDEAAIKGGERKLAGLFRGALRPGDGYAVKVQVRTLHGMSAADFLALEPWTWADGADPLSEP
jgi:hypothetical protein